MMDEKALYMFIPFTLDEINALMDLIREVCGCRELTKQEGFALERCKQAQRDYREYLKHLKGVSK